MIKIIATAPTSYQLNSLRAFHIGWKPRGNGSFYGEKEFDTEEDAIQYLSDLAHDYYDGDEDLIADNLTQHSLTLDAVTAHIQTL